ncbi:MAG TPA: diacylglycerol kinase family lipid kinase [Gemmatales bacterium]|nr:diacylglycerol kinase family lipid kinase [Gemmatales bacterium]
MENRKQALVLLNPRAGGGDAPLVQSTLQNAFTQHEWHISFHALAKGIAPGELIPLLQNTAAEGTSLVVAAGGDGTVSLVANAMILADFKDQLRLGVFPSGTGNSLSKELGIPTDWSEAAHLLATLPDAMPLDAMKMNDRYYFLRIGIGLDAEVIRDTSRTAKRRFGRWAYARSFLSRVFSPHRFRYDCTMDDKERSFKAVQLFIANGGQIALAPFRIGPDISSSDGVLNICAYDVHSWWHYFVVAWRLLRRDYHKRPHMKFWTIRKSITVQTKHPMHVQGDGETCASTPVTIEVLPDALRVVAVKLTNQ